MRQLLVEGWMHGRVRMIAASFLVKDLGVDWRIGERHFRRLLVDADPAQNVGNWQWVAGTGADAAPYFRIMNPITQSRRFDPDGAYIRRYVPELAALDGPGIHAPWERPLETAAAGVVLGRDYPYPMVDHSGGTRDHTPPVRCRQGLAPHGSHRLGSRHNGGRSPKRGECACGKR